MHAALFLGAPFRCNKSNNLYALSYHSIEGETSIKVCVPDIVISLHYQDYSFVMVTVWTAFTAAIFYLTVETVQVIASDIQMDRSRPELKFKPLI